MFTRQQKKLRKTALEMCFDILKNDSTSDKQRRIIVVERLNEK